VKLLSARQQGQRSGARIPLAIRAGNKAHPEFATSGEGPPAPSPDMLTFPSSNGGGGMPGPVAEVPLAFSRKAFRVNVFGTRALMLGWRESDCPGGCLAI
jgi:hypothetical protein